MDRTILPGDLKLRKHSRSSSAVLLPPSSSMMPSSPPDIRRTPRSKNASLVGTAMVSPRSPRGPLPSSTPSLRGPTKQKSKNLSPAVPMTDRVALHHLLAEDRRYVVGDANETKRSHRRAVSLSQHDDQLTSVAKQFREKSKKKSQPHTMRPVSSVSGTSSLHSSSANPLGNSPLMKTKKKTKAKLVDLGEQLGHRRSNSWDPRNQSNPYRRVSDATATMSALASKKAALAEKERQLLEKQSRQEAELISLAGDANVEKELEELLRLQRKLKSSPERRSNPVAIMSDDEHQLELGEDDELLMQTLDGLNHELQMLKQRTLRIENRVKELRCPGPTPLEMLTGGSSGALGGYSNPGPSSVGNSSFESLRPSNVRRVEARRSPPVVVESVLRHSPDQSMSAVTSFGRSPSFKSAFSSSDQ